MIRRLLYVLLASSFITAYGLSLTGRRKLIPKPAPMPKPLVWAGWDHELDSIEVRLHHGREREKHWEALASINNPRRMRE
jgi:hypothetical protein